jgi:alginate O-acetyltransferase complex protein AlgJ
LRNGRRYEQWATVGIFLTVVAVFFAGTWLSQSRELQQMEQHGLRKMPTFDMKEGFATFTAKFDSYFNDRSMLRKSLIAARNLVKVAAFGVSGSPQVLLGSNRWLFFAGDNSIESYLRTQPLTPQELAQWKAAVDARGRWLAERNIKFVMCVPPDKYTIYSEMLPQFLKPVNDKSRLDQLVECLRDDPYVQFVDVRPALIARKKDCQLYYKNDTHWNDEGAFVAYGELMKPIQKDFPIIKIVGPDDVIRGTRHTTGDLAKLIELKPYFKEDSAQLHLKNQKHTILPESVVHAVALLGYLPMDTHRPYLATAKPAPELPRLLFVHDSFCMPMMAWLPDAASRATFWWQRDLDADLINKEKPNAVIWEITERFLMTPPPVPYFPQPHS